MNWELIKEMLRREEVRARTYDVKEPVASIHMDSLEQWRIYVTDYYGYRDKVNSGQGMDDLVTLLNKVKSK